MTNLEKYTKVFTDLFDISKESAEKLRYQQIDAWDSVGHMTLISDIEDTFDIMMDTDDIIDLDSFEKGREILSERYNIEF